MTSRDRAGSTESPTRALDEVVKILTKTQAQEISAAEKVLAGQGDILNKKVKEIEDKYLAIHNVLRTLRDYSSQMRPIESMRVDVEKREAKLQADRNELERVLGDANKREAALQALEREVQTKAAEVDAPRRLEELARREKELQEQQADFESRLKAFQHESQALEHRKEEVARDWEKLSEEKGGLMEQLDKRAEELDLRAKQLDESQKRLNQEMQSYRKRVEEEVFAAVQRSILELIRSHYREGKGP